MIVDAHTHIHEPGMASARRPASTEALLQEMDTAGVDHALVIPLPGVASNEYVQRECARHADRLTGLYTPEFDQPAETVTKLQRFAETYPLTAVKIHPRVQGVSVEDALVRDVLDVLHERRTPVLFDCFPHGKDIANPPLLPAAYQEPAQRLAALPIVLAHAGGHKVLDAFHLVKAASNVVLEASFTLMYYRGASVERDLAFVIGNLRPGRIMYGSDFPSWGIGEYLEAMRRLTADLPPENAEAFFSGTARHVYRLGKN